jgi:hypothetical protein
MITKLAIKWLTWQLRKDPDWYQSYVANIAMCVYDRASDILPIETKSNLLRICNEGAQDFMKLWTNPNTK